MRSHLGAGSPVRQRRRDGGRAGSMNSTSRVAGLSRDASATDTFVQRFQREVEVIALLTHPNIVMAFDADEAEVGPFLVMEFVSGRDLASAVQERGPLPVREAVGAILQAARALEY